MEQLSQASLIILLVGSFIIGGIISFIFCFPFVSRAGKQVQQDIENEMNREIYVADQD